MTGPAVRPAGPGGAVGARQTVRAEGGFAYGTIGADIHVFGDGLPLYLLENWHPPGPADSAFLMELPSRMLNARFAVVGFTGRERELAELLDWCAQGPRLATRLLHAPGGQGKTRLAARLAQECDAAGWEVATATLGPGSVLPPPGSQDLGTDGAAGRVLIVDYADLWPLSHLTWLFSNALLHRDTLRTRVLLVARTADSWPTVRGVLANDQIGTSAQHLPELSGGTGARARMFTAARDSFAAHHGIDDPGVIGPPGSLEHPGLGLTLAVHMAALVAVDAYTRGVRPPDDPVALTIYLLDREHAHWARRYGDRTHDSGTTPEPTPPAVMYRAVFAAALTGPLPRGDATAVVEAMRLPLPPDRVLADHTACYPPADPLRDTVLEPLYPDRLAEDFLALTLPGHHSDYPAQPWAASALTTLLAPATGGPATGGGAPGGRSRRGLSLLVAAAHRWPHVGAGHLYPLLHDRPGLAVDAGSPALTALADLPDLPEELIDDITDALPGTTPVDLELGAAALGVRSARERLARPGDPAAQARTRINLANHLHQLARPEEALDATRQAVAAWRELAATATGPERAEYEQYLAQALTNLGNSLQRAHRTAEAVGAVLEAVAVNRQLVRTDPAGGHDHDLAVSLSNLGSMLTSAGQATNAVAALTEAVAAYQRLVRVDRDLHEPGLAIALTNLGGVLAQGGLTEEAIDPTRRAVRIWRRLTEANPDAYEAHLALALTNLTTVVRDSGRPADRLPVVEESVAIMRRLAQAHPHAHLESLAAALTLLTEALTRPGQLPQALDAARELATVRRDLVRAEATSRRTIALVEALRRLADVATAAGRAGEAASAQAEADAAERTVHQWLRSTGYVHHLAPPEVVARAAQRTAAGGPAGILDPPVDLDEVPVPWRTARDVRRAGRRLARAGRWLELWELTCSVPVVQACDLARRLPLDRWSPPGGPGARAVARRLAEVDRRQAARSAESAGPGLVRELPFVLADAGQISFAPDGTAISVEEFHRPEKEHSIQVYDLVRSRSVQLCRGTADHRAIRCLGADAVVTIRGGDRRTGRSGALVLYRAGKVEPLLDGLPVDDGSTLVTRHGMVAGLGTAPVAYVGVPGAALRHVDLSSLGVWRAGLLAADAAGTRLAVSDGAVVAVTDVELRERHAVLEIPAVVGDVAEVVFGSADDVIVAGTRGGLLRWRLEPSGPRLVAALDTPPLTGLFAIPAWRTVGGWAGSEARAYFFDDRTLQRMPPPPAILGGAAHLSAFTASPDGRYAIYGGHVPGPGGGRRRSVEHRTLLHDLYEPAVWVRRPLVSMTAADLPVLDRMLAERRPAVQAVRPLLELVRAVVAHRHVPPPGGPGVTASA